MCPLGIGKSSTAHGALPGESRLWLLLVGVDQYQEPGLTTLEYCTTDCEGLTEALREATLDFEVRSIFAHHDLAPLPPTLQNVRASLQRIVAAAQGNDLVLVYFSGHGVLHDGQAFLCLRDTRRADLSKTALGVRELTEQLEQCRAARQLVWLDACHSGAMTLEGALEPEAAAIPFLVEALRRRADRSKGFHAMLSCDQDQYSWSFPALGHGVFTYYLIEGLRGAAADAQGRIEADGLYRYVYHQTLRYLQRFNQQRRLLNRQSYRRGVDGLLPDYPLQTPKKIVNVVGDLVIGRAPVREALVNRYRALLVVEDAQVGSSALALGKLLGNAGGYQVRHWLASAPASQSLGEAVRDLMKPRHDDSIQETVLLYLRGRIEESPVGEPWFVMGDGLRLSRSSLKQALACAGVARHIVILDCPGATGLADWLEVLRVEGRGQCLIAAAALPERPEAFTEALTRALETGSDPRLGLSATEWIELIEAELTESQLPLHLWLSAAGGIIEVLPGNLRANRTAAPDWLNLETGPYFILQELGQGGMSRVYLGLQADGQRRRRVAIKVVKQEVKDEAILQRFRLERQILADLEHPNIARLLDSGTTEEDLPYFVIEYVEGLPIDLYCERNRLTTAQRLTLFTAVCRAVHYAHARQVIHLDLKPSNILVDREGVPKLLDFGISRLLKPERANQDTELTVTANRLMTPRYASPEQVRGETVGPASDIYSLGVLLYELLTGQRPYRGGKQLADLARAICEEEPDKPSWSLERRPPGKDTAQLNPAPPTVLPRELAGNLDNIMLMALRKEPERRYTSLASFIRDIEHHLAGRPILARPESPGYRVTKYVRKNRLGIAAAVAGIALTGGMGWLTRVPSAQALPEKAIAVLPFKNLNGDPESAHFSSGITEDITNELGKVSDLTIISSSAARKYGDTTKSLQEVAQELGVGSILTGKIRRQGDLLRIDAQLINTRNGVQLWSHSYDGPTNNVFTIQNDVATQISNSLRAKISSKEQQLIAQQPTSNLTAYDYYLKGNEYLRRYRKQDTETSILLFKRALAVDPNLAEAHAGLAKVYLRRAYVFNYPEKWSDFAIVEAKKAIAINPDLAEGHQILGTIYAARGWLEKALTEHRKAIELDPNNAPAANNYGETLRLLGTADIGLPSKKRSAVLDPTSIFNMISIGLSYTQLTDDNKAEEWFNKAISIEPESSFARFYLGKMFLLQGNFTQSLKLGEQILTKEPQDFTGLMNVAQAKLYQGKLIQAQQYYQRIVKQAPVTDLEYHVATSLGYISLKLRKPAEAARLMEISRKRNEALLLQGSESSDVPYDMALIQAVLNDKASAYQWLRKADSAGWRDYRDAKINPMFENLRGDKEFQKILAQVQTQVEQMRKASTQSSEKSKG